MVKHTFPNNFRHPITGEPYGLHSGPFDWISQLGLMDEEGMPLNGERKRDILQKYGYGGVRENPDQQVTLISNSGDHDYDQAATYLAQQAFQQGRTWFPKLGPAVPPEHAVRAAQEIQKLNGKTSAYETEPEPEFSTGETVQWYEDGMPRPIIGVVRASQFEPYSGDHMYLVESTKNVPYTIRGRNLRPIEPNNLPQEVNLVDVPDYLPWGEDEQQYYRTADVRDPVTEPNWMAEPSWEDEPCKYCGLNNCTHKGNSGKLIDDPNIIWHGMWEYENPHGVNV